jgi:hypothetical protein
MTDEEKVWGNGVCGRDIRRPPCGFWLYVVFIQILKSWPSETLA